MSGNTEANLIAATALQFLEGGQPAKAFGLLEKIATIDPENLALLRLKAEAQRLLGEEQDARALLFGLSEQDRRLAHYANPASLDPKDLIPHLRIEKAFPAEVRDGLLSRFTAAAADFTPGHTSHYGEKRLDSSFRSAKVLQLPEEEREAIAQEIYVHLPRVFSALGKTPFAPTGQELHAALYGDGDFLGLHVDRAETRAGAEKQAQVDRRALSFLYYFHRTPPRFTGGELILYDSLPGRGAALKSCAEVIQPADNQLLFFGTDVFHEVQKVALSSSDPADGRFVLIGWAHEEL